MTPKGINKAREIAKDFIAECDAIEKAHRSRRTWNHAEGQWQMQDVWKQGFLEVGKASGSLRRRSLDLTRALAEMRKS